ncbi:MAG: flagellin N-terminal helical domain-containing protein [Jatrophihabitans sp.]|uniref:flagellin N-terminal helical domain-containing protein n=1 Tax=Jatrophihabitans sp. TaxID=1932789 RepID=UPI003F7E9835
MSLRINTNVAALNAYNNLSANQAKQNMAFQQLSSGLRINNAADDAAGLSIASGLTSQINGLTQSVSNAQDGINVAQIADGSLATVQTILQRMRSLVVQAGNAGTMDSNSLNAITAEIGTLNSQLTNISGQTAFGGKNLLDGTYSYDFQVGANAGQVIHLDLSSAKVDATTLGTGGLQIASQVSGTYDPTTDLGTLDAALGTVNTARSNIGAVQNQLNYTVTNLQTAITNVTASRSNLTDADLATQVTNMTQAQILTSAATSVLAQANSAPQAILKLLQ